MAALTATFVGSDLGPESRSANLFSQRSQSAHGSASALRIQNARGRFTRIRGAGTQADSSCDGSILRRADPLNEAEREAGQMGQGR